MKGKILTVLSALTVVLTGAGLALQTIKEYFWAGIWLWVVGFYIGAHVVFGPLDWYLLYKLYKRLWR